MFLNTVLKEYVPTQVFCAHQVKQFIKRTEGASGIEYAIIVGMCAVVIVTFMTPLSVVVKSMFDKIATGLGTAATAPAS